MSVTIQAILTISLPKPIPDKAERKVIYFYKVRTFLILWYSVLHILHKKSHCAVIKIREIVFKAKFEFQF